jgi:methyl coenzyme M reductase subunit C-like uncharacterized protein (methanogenesis marker protein 7)
MEETDVNGYKRKVDGTFDMGTAPGPGRPVDTPEKIVEKKAIKQIVEEYKATLADSLPLISPVLVAKALESDVQAIKEIHDRVMGKAPQSVDVNARIAVSSLSEEDKTNLLAILND